jgi:hypothetical protein
VCLFKEIHSAARRRTSMTTLIPKRPNNVTILGLFCHSVARRRISMTTLIHSCIRPHVCATVHASAGNTRANAFAASLVLRVCVCVCTERERARAREILLTIKERACERARARVSVKGVYREHILPILNGGAQICTKLKFVLNGSGFIACSD